MHDLLSVVSSADCPARVYTCLTAFGFCLHTILVEHLQSHRDLYNDPSLPPLPVLPVEGTIFQQAYILAVQALVTLAPASLHQEIPAVPSQFHVSDSSVSSGASANLTAKSMVIPDVSTHAVSPGPKTTLGHPEVNTVTVPASAVVSGTRTPIRKTAPLANLTPDTARKTALLLSLIHI